MNYRGGRVQTPVLDRTLQVTQETHKTRHSLMWGCVNAILLAVVLYDVIYTCPMYTATMIYVEWVIALVLALNMAYHFGLYLRRSFYLEPVILTPNQKKLMGISDSGILSVMLTESVEHSNGLASDERALSLQIHTSKSLLLLQDIGFFLGMTSGNYTMSSPSWIYYQGSPSGGLSMSHNRCQQTSPSSPMTQMSNISSVDFIESEHSLSQYLRDFENFEKTAAVGNFRFAHLQLFFMESTADKINKFLGVLEKKKNNAENFYTQTRVNFEAESVLGQSVEQPSNLLSSFWSHPATRTAAEVPPMLRRCSYQLASPTTVPTTGSPGIQADDTGSLSSSLYQSQDVWRRVRVNPTVLTQWNANLRMHCLLWQWISQTILDRLVKEIEAVDEALQRHGLADVRVGSVGLERLKKTAQILQVAQNIPTLMSLVPFLDLTSNQEYLVTRIKGIPVLPCVSYPMIIISIKINMVSHCVAELAKGGCMSEYRWNGGGSMHNKDWEEHLPTDAAIVMHLFATYLDSQLPPLPQNPDGRPFTSQHFAKTPDKPPQGKNTLAIYQVQINPPHYVLLEGEDTLEVAKGRNNLFHTLLLFLHQVKTKEHGMLGRVNLGPSGVNLLWVIQT
ncbi:hypothetical protein ANN_10231 [Periplaneta americana]|uniref:Transmembrane protein 209 n=1 Tax=Periplaneta americana TaxID=6978 RepID=A0ABQ8TR85_PERAM|nr:hypothetical protein ANN_10231 [Periplaneta americana]